MNQYCHIADSYSMKCGSIGSLEYDRDGVLVGALLPSNCRK